MFRPPVRPLNEFRFQPVPRLHLRPRQNRIRPDHRARLYRPCSCQNTQLFWKRDRVRFHRILFL